MIEQYESKKHMLPNQSMPSSGIFESKLHLNNKQLQTKSFSNQILEQHVKFLSKFHAEDHFFHFFFANLRENYMVKDD